MDEIWQRHKSFIVQCMAGGLVFLIALVVKSNTYDGADDPEDMQRRNAATFAELQQTLAQDQAPSTASIDAQKKIAEEADRQITELAGRVASALRAEEYVRENLRWILDTLGKPGDLARYETLYKESALPQTALSRLREEARAELVGRAASLGKEVDETFGITGSYDDDEVPVALHGLAIVADVVRRCLEMDGIHAVTNVSVKAQGGRRGRRGDGDELTFLRSFSVSLTLVGEPRDVHAVLRSFNRASGLLSRLTVVDKVDGIARIRPDADTVKASFTLLGMQYLGRGQEEGVAK